MVLHEKALEGENVKMLTIPIHRRYALPMSLAALGVMGLGGGYIVWRSRQPAPNPTSIISLNPIDVPLSEMLIMYAPPDPPAFEPKGTRIYDCLKDCWGIVHVSLVINPDGAIVKAERLDGGGWAMAGEAAQYARQWRFVPYYANGKPQFVRTVVTLTYPNPGGPEPKGLHYSDPIDIPLERLQLTRKPTLDDWIKERNKPFHGEFEASIIFDPSGRGIAVETLKINSVPFKSRNGIFYPGDNPDKEFAMTAFECVNFLKRHQCVPIVIGKYARYVRTTLKVKI